MLVTVIPCVPFAVRAPEDMGLHPDGRAPAVSTAARPVTAERSYSLSEAMHSWVFWILLASIVFGSYSLQTGTIIMVPYFKDIGFSPGVAASAVSVYGFFSIAARFIWGFAADRLSVRRALVMQAFLTAIGAFFMVQIGGQFSLYVISAYMGVMLGGFPTLGQLIWPEFFGRTHIGSIVGVVQFFSTVIGSAGPLIAGLILDQTGSYAPALWLLVGTWLGCSLAVYAARPRIPVRQPMASA
jgi:MFS family permease